MSAAPDGSSPRGLSDRDQLIELLRSYAQGIDDRDFARCRATFTDDARLDYSSVGVPEGPVDEVLDRLAAMLAPVTLTHHLLSNHAVEIDGDTATTQVALFNPFVVASDDRTDVMLFGGRYDDRWRRTPTGWRIHHRVHVGTWHAGPLPGGLSPTALTDAADRRAARTPGSHP